MIVSYGDLSFDFAQVYQHDNSEEITAEYGGRWIVISADDKEIPAGIVSLGEESFGPNLSKLRKRFNLGLSGHTFAEKLGLKR